MKKTFLLWLFSLMPLIALAQNSVTGKVRTTENESLPGVQIMEKGTTNGTITDLDGNFSLTVGNEATLIIRYTGYKAQEVVVGNQTSLEIVMEVEETGLDEVVVIGYGTTKKKLATGANLNVKGESIQELTPTTAMDALKGISPGVSITQNNGQPGSGTKVFIRGIGTTGSSNPLYIVDGVAVGNIDYLSPADIESIDVLKDAASAAIYGSRAANGVILVTTRKGRQGKPVITYDAHTGWQNVYKKPDMLNAQEYMMIMNEGLVNDGHEPFDFSTIDNINLAGTDWFDEMTKKDSYVQSHALNITGGTERTIYSMGASYLFNEGIVGNGYSNSEYKRLNLRLNTEHVLFEKDGLKQLVIGQNLSYTNSTFPGVRTGDMWWNDVRNALAAPPIMPLYGPDGEYQQALPGWTTTIANPIASMDYNGRHTFSKANNIVGNVYTEISPIEGLKFRSSFGINAWFGNYRQWTPAYYLSASDNSNEDVITQNMNQGYDWTLTNTLSYSFDLNGEHKITALIGNELYKTAVALSLGGVNRNSNFNDPNYAYLNNVGDLHPSASITGSDYYGSALMSYFGRVSYNFRETYMLSAVLRADGSTNFIKGKRWGYFPSVAAGWVLSNESFMENTSSWLSFLKLRASWGQNGNQNIGSFQYSSTVTYSDANYFFGPQKNVRSIGGYLARVPNTNLTWETSEQLNIGADLHFLNARLQFAFDWYKKDTKDWLVTPPTLLTMGTNASSINGGRVTNKGVELSLRWNDKIGDFKYGISASLAHNKNEVTEIANDEKIIHGANNILSQGTAEVFRAQVGYPIGYFWGYQTNGILQNASDVANYVRPAGSVDADGNDVSGQPYFSDQRPGDVRYVDRNGDGLINDEDKTQIGDPNPDYIVGIQINAEYKGFYVSATATGNYGHQIIKSYRSFADVAKLNYTTDILNRWHGEGRSNKLPRMSSAQTGRQNYISDIYVEDADFLRISNLTIGYNFKELLKNLPIGEAKLYFTAKNLYTFTKYSGMDPEVGYGPVGWASGIDLGLYPQPRTFLIGLSVKF